MPANQGEPRVGIQLDATNNTARALTEAEAQLVRLNFANQQAEAVHKKTKHAVDEHASALEGMQHRLHEAGQGFSKFERAVFHVGAALVALKEGYELVAAGIELFHAKLEERDSVERAGRRYDSLRESIKGTTEELLKQGKISPAKAAEIQDRLATAQGGVAGFGKPSAEAQAAQQRAMAKLALEVADINRTTDKDAARSTAVKLAQDDLRLQRIAQTTSALTEQANTEDALLQHQFKLREDIFRQDAALKKADLAGDKDKAEKEQLIDVELQKNLFANEQARTQAVTALKKLRDEGKAADVEKQKELDKNQADALRKLDEVSFEFEEADLNNSLERRSISAAQFLQGMTDLIERREDAEIAAIEDVENREILSEAARIESKRRIAEATDRFNKAILLKEEQDARKRRQIQEGTLAATESMLGSAAQAAKLFGREGFIAYKAFSIAQAIVATALAVVKALAEVPYPANIVAAIAAGAAGAVQIATIVATNPSFEEGGYTGPGGRRQPVGIVHAQEFVLPAPVVAKWGAEHFEAYRRGLNPFTDGPVTARSNMSGLFATGGLAPDAFPTRAGLDSSSTTNVGIIHTRQDQRRFMQQEGVNLIVSALNRRGNRVRS